MLRAPIVILLSVLVSHPTVAQSKEISRETILLVHLSAFKPLGLGLEQSLELASMANALVLAGLSTDCLPEAANIDVIAFDMAFQDNLSTLHLIHSGVPVKKAISTLQICQKKRPDLTKAKAKDIFLGPADLLLQALHSTGQNIKKRHLEYLLEQSKALFQAGFESDAPFKAAGIDLDQIPDAFLDDVSTYLDKYGQDKPLPFEGDLGKGLI